MSIKTALVGTAAILIWAFLALNWRALAAPVNFSFLVATISMPTGYLVVVLLLAGSGARFETELSALRGEVSASERSLAAMIAELDDRVHHGGRAQ